MIIGLVSCMIKERIYKLVNVKSIITILLTLLFIVLSIKGEIPSEVTNLYTVVISFYFGTQTERKRE